MKHYILIVLTIFITCELPLTADDRFVYDSMFAGGAVDDGTNNREIVEVLFRSLQANASTLNHHGPNPLFVGALLDSMLQIRAFCDQRKDSLKLNANQKSIFLSISSLLSSFNVSYHPNQGQELVDLCAKNPDLMTSVQTFAKAYPTK